MGRPAWLVPLIDEFVGFLCMVVHDAISFTHVRPEHVLRVLQMCSVGACRWQ